MEQERRIDGRQIFDSMLNFARLGSSRGVNNFVLVGPVDVPTIFHTFAGAFPNLNESDSPIAVAGRRDNAIDVYSQILQLKVPQRIEDLKIKDSEEIRKICEKVFAAGNLPLIVIGIGEARDTEEEVVVLYSIIGFSPKGALLEIQDRIKSRMAKFN